MNPIISDNENHSQYTVFIPMKKPDKLTKEDIAKRISVTPIDQVLGKSIKGLTHKQKVFSENIALKGMNKTEAYIEAGYSKNQKPEVLNKNASVLSNNSKVLTMINQLNASEAIKNLISASSLRASAIQNITEIALDPEQSARDRLKALELIGKFDEVNLFNPIKTEKTVYSNSDEVKAKLITALKNAFNNNKTLSDIKMKDANSLLDEIRGEGIQDAELIEDDITESENIQANPEAFQDTETPPHPTPLNSGIDEGKILHNIPDKQSAISDRITPVLDEEEEEGEGVSEILRNELGIDIESTPLDDLDQN